MSSVNILLAYALALCNLDRFERVGERELPGKEGCLGICQPVRSSDVNAAVPRVILYFTVGDTLDPNLQIAVQPGSWAAENWRAESAFPGERLDSPFFFFNKVDNSFQPAIAPLTP